MMFNPVIAMLYNSGAERWHPIVFVEHPLPGGAGPTRHKSKGHHTDGFATKEEAEAYAKGELAQQIAKHVWTIGEVKLRLDVVLVWDGKGTPAMVHFFTHEPKSIPT